MRRKFRFEDLEIWQEAMAIMDLLLDIADELDAKRLFRFTDQLRGAALSITNNIAEGSGSTSVKGFAQCSLLKRVLVIKWHGLQAREIMGMMPMPLYYQRRVERLKSGGVRAKRKQIYPLPSALNPMPFAAVLYHFKKLSPCRARALSRADMEGAGSVLPHKICQRGMEAPPYLRKFFEPD